MELSYLTGFDVEVQISSPNMCSHDKHCAREGALHAAMLYNPPMMFLLSIGGVIMKIQSI